MDNSVIISDQVIDRKSNGKEAAIPKKKINRKKATCKMQDLYILLTFLLITMELIIAVSIYCYLIKLRAKQEHLLSFHITNNKLREIIY